VEETLTKVFNQERYNQIQLLIDEGYQYRCLRCSNLYKIKPGFCSCHCDLFMDLNEFSNNFYYTWEHKSIWMDGVKTHIFKEHNFTWCQCQVSKKKMFYHTGNTNSECGSKWKHWEEIRRSDNEILVQCPISGWRVLVLRSTKEEIKNAGYVMCPVEFDNLAE